MTRQKHLAHVPLNNNDACATAIGADELGDLSRDFEINRPEGVAGWLAGFIERLFVLRSSLKLNSENTASLPGTWLSVPPPGVLLLCTTSIKDSGSHSKDLQLVTPPLLLSAEFFIP